MNYIGSLWSKFLIELEAEGIKRAVKWVFGVAAFLFTVVLLLFIRFWSWLTAPMEMMPIWWVLLSIVGFWLLVWSLLLKRAVKNLREAEKCRNTIKYQPPEWICYNSDNFKGAHWEWEYDLSGKVVTKIRGECPLCGGVVRPDMGADEIEAERKGARPKYEHYIYVKCSTCDLNYVVEEVKDLHQFADYLVDQVERGLRKRGYRLDRYPKNGHLVSVLKRQTLRTQLGLCGPGMSACVACYRILL